MRTLRFPDETDDAFRQRAMRAGVIARILVEACLSNVAVQDILRDPMLPYSVESLRRSPIVRVEYDEAFAIGGIGECLAATKNKHWGAGPWVMPLLPDDPVAPDRILYVYKEGSLYNRRFLQRRRLKEVLGRAYRPLVGKAMAARKRDFLAELQKADAQAIRHILHVAPGDFWRAARGKLFLDFPPRHLQRELPFME